MSGRGRSGGAVVATCRYGRSPRPIPAAPGPERGSHQRQGSWAGQPVSQFAPQPVASAAFTSPRHTAPDRQGLFQLGEFSRTVWGWRSRPRSNRAVDEGLRAGLLPVQPVRGGVILDLVRPPARPAGCSSTMKRHGSSLPWSGHARGGLQTLGPARPGPGRARAAASPGASGASAGTASRDLRGRSWALLFILTGTDVCRMRVTGKKGRRLFLRAGEGFAT